MVVEKKAVDTTGGRKLPSGSTSSAQKRRRKDDVMRKRVDAVVEAARQIGLIGEKSGRIGGRVSPALVEEAKKLTGLQSDTDLLEFALANVALKDDFPESLAKLKGTVGSDARSRVLMWPHSISTGRSGGPGWTVPFPGRGEGMVSCHSCHLPDLGKACCSTRASTSIRSRASCRRSSTASSRPDLRTTARSASRR